MKNKVLASLGILIGLILIGGVFSGSTKPEVAGTKIVAPTPTPTATPTPTPTSTPTPTPKPTFIPKPKPTIQPTSAPAVQAPSQVINAGCGTYTNSEGNLVARPCPADTTPSGATARCRDGSYSYSQSRRGTCSSHGGVAQWL